MISTSDPLWLYGGFGLATAAEVVAAEGDDEGQQSECGATYSFGLRTGCESQDSRPSC